jgi:hypothetical protein
MDVRKSDPMRPQMTTTLKNSSPKNYFMGMGNEGNKLSQKLGPIKDSNRYGARVSNTVKNSATSSPTGDKSGLQSQQSLGAKKKQKSPHLQDTQEVDLGDDDYDDETDEFAGYSGS